MFLNESNNVKSLVDKFWFEIFFLNTRAKKGKGFSDSVRMEQRFL